MADGGSIARRKMPAQKPSKSNQVVATPMEFVDAVESRFGKIHWDVCANAENCVVRNVHGGRSAQFFSERENGLAQQWSHMGGNLWCNPPFGKIAPWAKKASEEANPHTRVLMLTPAAVGANWWWEYVRPHAVVYILHPRLAFTGQPFPKDLQLAVFGLGATGFGRWRWTKEAPER